VVAITLLIPLTANLIYLWCCCLDANRPFDVVGPAELAVQVRWASEGEPLYRDFRVPPYDGPHVYAPVVPYLAVPLAKLFGSDPLAPLKAGRALTIIATLAASLLTGVLVWRSGASAGAALLVSLAFLFSPLLEPWAFEFRGDIPALAVELGALILFQAEFVSLSVALLVLSFFIKQTSMAAIAAIVLSTWLAGNRRQAFVVATAWFGSVVIITATLEFVLPYYWLNNYAPLIPFYDLSAPLEILILFWDNAWPIFVLAALGLLIEGPRKSLSVCFLLAAFTHDAFSSLRWGSNSYYFLPTLAAAAAAAAPRLDRLLAQTRRLPRLAQLAFGLLIAFLIVSAGPHRWTAYNAALHEPPFSIGKSCANAKTSVFDPEALNRLHDIDGPVLTDVGWLDLVRPAKNVWFLEMMPLRAMRARGSFDDRALIAALDRRQIAAVALDEGLLERDYRGRAWFWPELRDAIARNYYFLPSPGPPFVALPRSNTAH